MQTIGTRPAVSAACVFLLTRVVGLAEQRAALGVADDHVTRAGLADHRRADLAGERAFALPMQVLRGDAMALPVAAFDRGREGCERRRDRDVDAAHVLDQRAQIVDVRDRLGDGLEHLEVAGDQRCAHTLNNLHETRKHETRSKT